MKFHIFMMFKFSIFFKTQNTAIHIAAKYKKLNILKILIDYNKAIFKINDSISFYDKYLFRKAIWQMHFPKFIKYFERCISFPFYGHFIFHLSY